MPRRLDDLVRFYQLLSTLENRIGGARLLGQCHGRMPWPARGVYFFREPGQERSDSGSGPRIVRVGTHALTSGSSTTLWNRLSQHRGQQASGGGNHRGSIFRLLVGSTLPEAATISTWGVGSNASRNVRAAEHALERVVSSVIWAMPVLWLPIDDAPGPDSLRGYIERNSIGLLSNLGRDALDPPSTGWRGHRCVRGKALVRDSGLWNQNHVEQERDAAFFDVLQNLIIKVEPMS
jgi:hypothetical protein